MPKLLFTLTLLLVASTAGARYMPAYTYNAIYVVNDSDKNLSNVTIEDARYGVKHSCGDIAPRGTCSLRTGSRSYQENPLRVSWDQQSEELQLDVPLSLATGPVLRGIITFGADGSLSTSADQPSRR